jgi:hypothetical protein
LGEHQAGSLGVVGSIPTSSTILKALKTAKFKQISTFLGLFYFLLHINFNP